MWSWQKGFICRLRPASLIVLRLLRGIFSGDDISEWVKITNNYTAPQDGNRNGSLITIDEEALALAWRHNIFFWPTRPWML
jgi:hypothetical protein